MSNFKPVKLVPYSAAIKKQETSLWSKFTGLFRRKRQPAFRQYLLLDDQIAYSGEDEYYEHIEDEE